MRNTPRHPTVSFNQPGKDSMVGRSVTVGTINFQEIHQILQLDVAIQVAVEAPAWVACDFTIAHFFVPNRAGATDGGEVLAFELIADAIAIGVVVAVAVAIINAVREGTRAIVVCGQT